jgi:glycosyltransferase involved in cell wall biosynthesis
MRLRALKRLVGDFGEVFPGQVFEVIDPAHSRNLLRRGIAVPHYEVASFSLAPRERDYLRPLVSCLMPTADRPAFVPGAVRCWLEQTYDNKELVVLDNGKQPIQHLLPQDNRISYARTTKSALGEMRNRACELARGEVLCHWDDDDWSAPDRLERQVELLQTRRADIAGFHSMLFVDLTSGRCEKYCGDPNYAIGTSLMFRREWWAKHHFPNLHIGEDSIWINTGGPVVAAEDARGTMFARVHPLSTAEKFNGAKWRKASVWELPEAAR